MKNSFLTYTNPGLSGKGSRKNQMTSVFPETNENAGLRRKNQETRQKMSLKTRAERLKTEIPALFLALRDQRTPVWAKVLAFLTVAYALSPVDLVPDFIPVLGYLDDLLILPGLAALTIRLIPREVMEDCRTRAGELWKDGKPKKWYYALPIVLVWALIVFVIVKLIFFR